MIDKNVVYPMVGVGTLEIEPAHPRFVLHSAIPIPDGSTLYFSKEGEVTSNEKEAFCFWSASEAIGVAEAFRFVLHQVAEKGKVTELKSLVLCKRNHDKPYEYFDLAARVSTQDIRKAFDFRRPEAAENSKKDFAELMGVSAADITMVVMAESIPQVLSSINEAARQLGIPANPEPKPSKEPYFVIRFVDPNHKNDTEGEITSPHWVRYYNEADLALYMEAAEVFDNVTSATSIFNILRDSAIEDGALVHRASESIMLKMRLLADVEQDTEIGAMRIFFNQGMIIQVLSVKETETGELQWDTIVQDKYQWIYPSPEQDREDEEVESEEDDQ